MTKFRIWIFCALLAFLLPARTFGQKPSGAECARPAIGSVAPEPEDLRSVNGVLKVDFTFRNFTDANGRVRYCYVYKDGSEAPNLRLNPGDLLILSLRNELSAPGPSGAPASSAASKPATTMPAMTMLDGCDGATGAMTATSTNMHFHGLSIPPVCHQDETLKTLIAPGDAPFEYRFRVPDDTPPGLYWYHPHPHGFSKAQVLGGASGAMIIEGIERANRKLAGLPERVLIVRDEELLNPNAEPAKTDMPPPIIYHDREGDVLNTGTGTGKPAKDLSINFVPVPYPDYPPAVIEMKSGGRELWRVLNASAITYLNLQVLYNDVPQPLGVVALDGVPLNENGVWGERTLPVSHVVLPPAGRVEFVIAGPAEGVHASLVTRAVDTGPAGENDPLRDLAKIEASVSAPGPRSKLAVNPSPLPPLAETWLGKVPPVRGRKLYFSETPQDPKDPNSPTVFFITVEGQTPKAFDPRAEAPNIVVQQGTVEDWVIENRTQEFHAFHIHQIHFVMTEWNGRVVDEPFLRDTVNVEYWDGKSATYPSVRLRMDFRDPEIAGTFVYHCHLLEHEDNGMMGTVRVENAEKPGAGGKSGH